MKRSVPDLLTLRGTYFHSESCV